MDYKAINKEITDALSVLKLHGLNIDLTDELKKRFDHDILFDGDDGLFKSLIKDVNIYFEYGCGKSTEYIYRHTKSEIFSVDTSKMWVEKVKNISSSKINKRLNLHWVDIGEITNWGYPSSFKMRKNFFEYANWFWKQDLKPDLVLIDGRFRVFCFLTTLRFAPEGTKIIFDDYTNRPFYHIVEEFCPIIDKCGRQALFIPSKEVKELITDEILLSFQNVIN